MGNAHAAGNVSYTGETSHIAVEQRSRHGLGSLSEITTCQQRTCQKLCCSSPVLLALQARSSALEPLCAHAHQY